MNILNLIQSQLSPQAISQIGNTIGESPESTKSAIGTAVPAVMGALLGKANASPDGPTQVFNAIQQGESQGGGWMNSIGSVLSGGSVAQTGTSSILNSLLGSKLGGVSNFIASACGIKGSSAMSILGMAAPLVMGTLSKHAASEGLGAAGLGQLLNSQAGNIKDALPAGLANTLGIGSLLSGSHDTTPITTETAADQQRQPYARPSAVPASPRRSNTLKWAVPLVIALGLAAWALSRRAANEPPATGGTADYTQTQMGHAINMPDFSSLNLTPGSIADRVAKAVSSGNFNQKIDLDNLSFNGSGQLSESASGQIQQLGSVLKAAPNLKLSITAYGSTQEEALNKANSLKSALVSKGISTDRILAGGETGDGVPNLRVMR